MKRKALMQNIQTKTTAELEAELRQRRDRLWSLHIDLAGGKVKNVAEIRQIRREIARILTTLRELRDRDGTAEKRS
jgi:ribosomal protein L29